MTPADTPALALRLAHLADVLGARAPSSAALALWADALAECAAADAFATLADWPRSNARMPTPADILRITRERISERIERTAADHARANRQPWSVERLRSAPGSTAHVDALAAIRRALAQPRPHPRAWAERLRDREHAGETLGYQQRRLWRAALDTPA
ncbi:MAG TPA: hypothetical protein VLH79_07185 [Chthonomonadales bacterium]|nr:hypothetical protein [Chthonomonadales bacterium]